MCKSILSKLYKLRKENCLLNVLTEAYCLQTTLLKEIIFSEDYYTGYEHIFIEHIKHNVYWTHKTYGFTH